MKRSASTLAFLLVLVIAIQSIGCSTEAQPDIVAPTSTMLIPVTTPTPLPSPSVLPTPTPTPSPSPTPASGSVVLSADFSADITDTDGPTLITFTDRSTGIIDSWSWDLNGDGIIDSTERNPTYYYDTNGYYSVILSISGPDGEQTLTKSDYIHVTGCGG